MAEPITLGVGALIWEYALKPIADSIKKEYGDETKKILKSLVNNVLSKEELDSKAIEIIETEIIDMDSEILSDKDRFLDAIMTNQKIRKITNSFTKIENSQIDIVLGENGEISNSVKNVKDSTINIR